MKMKLAAVLSVLTGAFLASFYPGVHAQQPPPAFDRAPDALERVTWRTRTLVGSDKLTDWKFAVPATGVGASTFLDAVVRADAVIVNFLEASSTQTVGGGIQKPLDYNLTAAEREQIKAKLGPERILAYHLESLPADADTRRKVFELARDLGTPPPGQGRGGNAAASAAPLMTIVVPANTDLTGIDALADQYRVDVAVLSAYGNGTAVVSALQGHDRRVGLGIDTGIWAQEGIAPAQGLAAVKDRLLYVRLGDRSARGAGARHVPLGKGVGNLSSFFNELNRLEVRPLAMTLDTTGLVSAPADLNAAVSAFEDAVQPAYAAFFTEYSKEKQSRFDVVHAGRGQTIAPADMERQTAEMKAKIEAAIPAKPYATPKKPRKLLVIDSLEGMSHDTIGNTNVMLQLMGQKTGAFTAVFDNDLENLRYPKIKEYDAVFLNSIVGEFMPDPAMREGFVRYIKEGGGMAGIHGTPWASRNWDEFAEMIGAQSAPHRIEHGILKVFDPASPIVQSFHREDLPFQEEFYRFNTEGMGRLRWDKVHVLLTVALDDPKVEPRPWNGYKRPDNIYPVAWIREYGKGRVFYNSMGHMPATFFTPEIVGHFLAGIQYVLGDLDANATPNPMTMSKR